MKQIKKDTDITSKLWIIKDHFYLFNKMKYQLAKFNKQK